MNRRTVVIGIIVVLGIIALGAVGFYLVSPLFIDATIDEAFPAGMPSPDELAQMSESELADIEEDVMATAAAMPDQEMEEAMPAGEEPVLVFQTQFMDADSFHQGSGTATVYELADGSRVLRFEDFMVTNGPDLHVILSSNPAPTGRDNIGDDYIDLGQLKGNLGNQNYDIPADVNLDQYQSIVIYCMPFHVVFATASR